MASLNSYLGMTENDFLYAKGAMVTGDAIGNYNMVASIAAQSAEKYLKAVVEKCFFDEDIISFMKSHNLRSLYNKIITQYSLNVTSKDCKWLGDFYFDARYPGDNFVVVNKQDAEECLEILNQISVDTKSILEKEEQKREQLRQQLSAVKAF